MSSQTDTFRYPLRAADRYTGLAQAIHWLTALLVFAILPIAWHGRVAA